jgi:hypothetical protein
MMPYNPTWSSPYTPSQGPYVPNPMMGQQTMPSYGQHQYQPGVKVMVDGAVEAQNRLMMMYSPQQLVPGFTSDIVWDVNGKQFYALSVENDGRRNFEIFDFAPHAQEHQAGVSRQEFDALKQTVEHMNGVLDGIYGHVSPASPAANAVARPDAAAPGNGIVSQGNAQG